MTYQTNVRSNRNRVNRWQDWATFVLSIWLFVSPWVLNFGSTAAPMQAATGGAAAPIVAVSNAAWNAWVLGVIVFLVSISAIGHMEFWQERINVILGAWIFAAPWVLGFAAAQYWPAAWDHWIVGALIFICSVWNLSTTRRPMTAGIAPPAGRDSVVHR